MQVILLERIERLGQMGDVVNVKPGYARNFLLPQKKAMRATKENVEAFEGQRKQLEAENLEHREEAEKLAEKLDGTKVVVIRSAGETGHLYGSVNARDIATAVTEAGFTVDRSQVLMEHAVKTLGFHDFRIKLHPEVDASVTINVARTVDEAAEQERLGHAIISDEEEQQVAEEEAPVEAVAAPAKTPEAESKAESEVAESGESEAKEEAAETDADAEAATDEEKSD
ncbi:MAG: 50S ribosomal protein L9 [Alphaproteobacteria bacterium]|jgi:large subunit ribosomal protein L9|nr:50S ribosomal protein L9 [Alphaproteobacteria bacterium]